MDEMYMQTVRPYEGTERFEVKQVERKQPVKKRWEWSRFYSQNSEIARNIAIVLAIVLVTNLITYVSTRVKVTARMEAIMAENVSAAAFRAEQDTLSRVKEEYGINAVNLEKAQMEEEAKTVAKILYPMRNNREAGLHLACWAVFDRVDNLRYSDDLYSVCSADQAFMGWSDSNPVLDDLYSISFEEVQRWHTGVRPLDTAFVYLYWSPNEIYLFDDYGHKFFESDWTKYMDTQRG